MAVRASRENSTEAAILGRRPALVLRKRLAGILSLALVPFLAFPAVALGYNPNAAAAWADAHWNTCGVSGVYECFGNDCTAFVSEAMKSGGGYVEVTPPPPFTFTSDDHYWYGRTRPKDSVFIYSHSFSIVPDLWQFLIWDYPGGFPRASKAGTSLASDSGADTGDVLFYDWDSNGTKDHATFLVGVGTSTDGYSGDYIDSHTNSRYHVFWTLRTYNQYIQTTTIYPMHIDAAN